MTLSIPFSIEGGILLSVTTPFRSPAAAQQLEFTVPAQIMFLRPALYLPTSSTLCSLPFSTSAVPLNYARSCLSEILWGQSNSPRLPKKSVTLLWSIPAPQSLMRIDSIEPKANSLLRMTSTFSDLASKPFHISSLNAEELSQWENQHQP